MVTKGNKPGNAVISKNKMPQFENKLNNIDWIDVLQASDLDKWCNTLMKTLTELIENIRFWLKKGSCTEKVTVHLLIFKGLRNMVVRELRKAKNTYFTQMIAESEGNSTALWKHLNLTSY